MTKSGTSECKNQGILSCWLWLVPLLLTAATLSFYQIDMFPPSVDEFATMYSAGWLGGEVMSATEFLQSLVQTNIANLPGYNLLLSVWGNLTAYEIAVARILGIFLYLLMLAQIYRLARDLIAPVAGLFAVIIVMSNAYFNFYIAEARPYTLFVLLSCVTVWQYLRIMHRKDALQKRDLVSLGAAVFALMMTHLFCATLLFSLGLYHLFFLPRNRRWLLTGLVITLAVFLCLPLVALVLTQYSVAHSHLEGKALNAIEAIAAWLRLMLNDKAAPLLLISVAGLYFGKQKLQLRLQSWLVLPALFLVTLALLAEFSTLTRAATMRHQLDGWVLLILFAAAGHYALYRWKPWLGILLASWVLAGLMFQTSASWWHHIVVRAVVFSQPPIHMISRLTAEANLKPNLVGYPYDAFVSLPLNYKANTGGFYAISMSQYYFSQYDMEIDVTDDLDEFSQLVRRMALQSPSIWFFHSNSADYDELAAAYAIMSKFNYRRCGETQVGLNTIINLYMWDLFDCRLPVNPAAYQTEFIEYEFFKTGLNASKDAVLFIDRWTPLQDFDTSSYSMSFQLLSEDWNNVAQLDLPLVHEAELRQFSIDVSGVPPGQYRLMLILYHKTTGDRLAWEGNTGYVPEMLMLGEVTITSF